MAEYDSYREAIGEALYWNAAPGRWDDPGTVEDRPEDDDMSETPHADAEQHPTGGLVERGALVTKLAQVMGEIHRVPKRGRNEHFGYDYATEADITDAVRQKMAERSVMVLPSVNTVKREGTLTTIGMTFTFYDGDTGASLAVDWVGVGDDKSDKGIWKAMTGAVKYLIAKSFLIPTGDDPEQHEQHEPQERKRAARPTKQAEPPATPAPTSTARVISDGQRKRLYAIAKNLGWQDVELKAALKARLGVESSKDIPVARYDEFVKLVEQGTQQ